MFGNTQAQVPQEQSISGNAQQQDQEREITYAINYVQALNVKVAGMNQTVQTTLNRIFGAEVQTEGPSPDDCGEGDLAQLKYCLNSLHNELEALNSRINRFNQL